MSPFSVFSSVAFNVSVECAPFSTNNRTFPPPQQDSWDLGAITPNCPFLPLATTNLLYVFMDLLILELFHINGIIQYVDIRVWVFYLA